MKYQTDKSIVEMEFKLSLNDDIRGRKTICNTFTFKIPFAKVSKVMVSIEIEGASNVTWGANLLRIPNFIRDGYVSYDQYSLAPPESRFWVSSNRLCEELGNMNNDYPCCSMKKACPLYTKGK